MPVNRTDQLTMLFDAITYEKGGSVLKQLRRRVGSENYRRGVSNYLKENAYGTTVLADFIGHLGRSADIDLSDWSDEWLTKPGFNTLRVEYTCDGELLSSLTIAQSAIADHPQLRAHSFDVALYNSGAGGSLVVSASIPALIEGERSLVDVSGGFPCPEIVNPNHNDWTFARFALSDADKALLSERIRDVSDSLSRSMFLTGQSDMAAAGDISMATFVRQALRLAESEQNFRVLEQISASLIGAVDMMQRLRPETDYVLPSLIADIERLALQQAEFAKIQDVKQLWFDTFLRVLSSDAGLGKARALLDGAAEIDGIEISPEIRWQLLTILSSHGVDDIADLLAAEIERDLSDYGQRSLLAACAAAPDIANKEKWVAELQNPTGLTSLARQRAVIFNLFPATQTDLQLQVLERILSSLPATSEYADPYFLTSDTSVLLRPVCRPESGALMRATLDEHGEQLNPTALQFLREAHQADVECESLRAAQ